MTKLSQGQIFTEERELMENVIPEQLPPAGESSFSRDGKSAVLRFAAEDGAWNIFTKDGVFVASLTQTAPEAGSGYTLVSQRVGPTDEVLVFSDAQWSTLVLGAILEFEEFGV
jgi:hypothetical protein